MRFLVANLLHPDNEVDFKSLDDIVPDIYAATPKKLDSLDSPRFLKSHEYFDPRYCRTIYIVRDPRDVAISYYFHHLKCNLLNDQYPISRFVENFVTGALDPFGTWHEHVGSWLGARRHHPNFLLLRYEDILSDTKSALSKISSHIQLEDADEDIVAHAVQESSFNNMRRKEKEIETQWKKKTRIDIPFVRKGAHQQWKTQLPSESISLIESQFAQYMKELEYL